MKSRRPPVHIPSEPLTFALRQAAQRFPDKAAIIEPESGGLRLTARGVATGDRGALWTKNSVEYVLAFYGILKAGGIVVPVSTHFGERELAHQLQVTEAMGIIAAQDRFSLAKSVIDRLQLRVSIAERGNDQIPPGSVSFSSLLNGTDRFDRSLGIDPAETLAVLPFSSGTTGLPKAVMLTHANLLSNLYQVT
jgi:acyl-CoA synthetase (AMP-forming)/AMP-acid ligase II